MGQWDNIPSAPKPPSWDAIPKSKVPLVNEMPDANKALKSGISKLYDWGSTSVTGIHEPTMEDWQKDPKRAAWRSGVAGMTTPFSIAGEALGGIGIAAKRLRMFGRAGEEVSKLGKVAKTSEEIPNIKLPEEEIKLPAKIGEEIPNNPLKSNKLKVKLNSDGTYTNMETGEVLPIKKAEKLPNKFKITLSNTGELPPPTLPKDLQGAKPRYNIRDKSYSPKFESDIDRAAYITAQTNPSKRDADYLKFVMDNTGLDEKGARALGNEVKAKFKDTLKNHILKGGEEGEVPFSTHWKKQEIPNKVEVPNDWDNIWDSIDKENQPPINYRKSEPEITVEGKKDIFGYPADRDLTPDEVEKIKKSLRKNLIDSYSEDTVEGNKAADEIDGIIDVDYRVHPITKELPINVNSGEMPKVDLPKEPSNNTWDKLGDYYGKRVHRVFSDSALTPDIINRMSPDEANKIYGHLMGWTDNKNSWAPKITSEEVKNIFKKYDLPDLESLPPDDLGKGGISLDTTDPSHMEVLDQVLKDNINVNSGEMPNVRGPEVSQVPEEFKIRDEPINSSDIPPENQLSLGGGGDDGFGKGKGPPPIEPEDFGKFNWGEWNKKPLKDKILDVLSSSRSVQSVDFTSALFRQGIGLVHKKAFWNSIKPAFKAMGSEEASKAIAKSIINHPLFNDAMKEGGVSFTGFKNLGREEQFQSHLAEHVIPLISEKTGIKLPNAVRSASRGYNTFINKLRMDSYASLVRNAEKAKLPVNKKAIGKFINSATGRGTFKSEKLESMMPGLNQVIYSPRLMKARLDMLNPINYVSQANKGVRLEYLKSAAAIAGVTGTTNMLFGLMGADTNGDMNSSDFGKVKFSNARLDPMGGFQQYMVLMHRLGTGFTTNSLGRSSAFDSRYGGPIASGAIGNFIRNKLAPLPAATMNVLTGKDSGGNDTNAWNEAIKLYTPMITQDAYDLFKDDPSLLPLLIPGNFGMGIQDFKVQRGGKKGPFSISMPRIPKVKF